ncbi:HET-domain-containing protein [Decorospora gaudefroyi]|uniref:HET-domain-containing protein n=1 Tax=Decorospora gaudefroyi TaxID=184978 RepID=A0A6A5KNG3_9PLEO|nr:HET-domain-containing protein [Decorospora gaudefroyi]
MPEDPACPPLDGDPTKALSTQYGKGFCHACKRLLSKNIEVAKPCTFTSPFERKPEKDEFHIAEEYYVHHPEGGVGLKQAASQGCPFCCHIWLSLSKDERTSVCRDIPRPGFQPSDFVTRYKLRFDIDDASMSKYCIMEYKIRHLRRSRAENNGRELIRLDTEIEKRFYIMPVPDTPTVRPPSPDLTKLAGRTIQQIHRWLKTCNAQHSCTGSGATAIEYPVRLIDVGTVDRPRVRLCDVADLPKPVTYVTLSHCWGKQRFYVLNETTEGELRVGIESCKLSRSHQQSIELTRRLGFRYIWIDSLCIIQDSPDDWASESVRMMTIYSNSYLTIAATASPDGTRGLFFPREDTDVDPVVFKLGAKNAQNGIGSRHDTDTIELVRSVFQSMKMNSASGKEYTPGKYDIFYFTDASVWQDGVPRSPLCQRAWCLQERVLSSRVVHFGEKQLLFQCQSMHACSRFPDGIPSILIPPSEKQANLSVRNVVREKRKSEQNSRERAYNIWKGVVTTYSSCDLTFGKDKLVAISGIASYLGAHFAFGNYLAGIWSYRALDQLLWEAQRDVVSQSGDNFRSKDYQAPSWSWASVNCGVKFSAPRYPPLAELRKGYSTTKDPKQKFSEVKSGAVILHGVLIPTTSHQQMNQVIPSLTEFTTLLRLANTDAYVEPAWDDWLDSRAQGLVCAPLAFMEPHKGVVGLVLLPTTTTTADLGDFPTALKTYRRAGMFSLHSDLWTKFRGRQVNVPYTLERGPDGGVVRSWPNVPVQQPSYEAEDRTWVRNHSENYLVV